MSDEKLRDKRLSELYRSLLKRDYPKSLIKNGIEIAKQISRKDLLTVKIKTEEDILPYVSTYKPRNPEAYTIINHIYRYYMQIKK